MRFDYREHYRQAALRALDEALEAKRRYGAESKQHRAALERYEIARSTMQGEHRRLSGSR